MIKSFLLASALVATTLASACNGISDIASSPRNAAEQTVLDEKAAIAVEAAWATAGTLIETGVDAGLIKGETARRVNDLDAKAERAVKAARSAYDAGNADDYNEAVIEAISIINEITALVNGETA